MKKAYFLISTLLVLSACSSSDHVNRPTQPSSSALPVAEAPETTSSLQAPRVTEPVASLTRDEDEAAQVNRDQAIVGEDRASVVQKPSVNPSVYSLRQGAKQGLGVKIGNTELFRRLTEKGSGLITFQHGKILAGVNSLNLNEPWCQFVSVTPDLDRAAIYTFTGFKNVGDNSVGFKLSDKTDKLVGVCSSGSGHEINLNEFREVLGGDWTVIHGD